MISLRSGTSWHMSLTSTTVFTEQVLGFPCQLNAVVPFQGMEPNKDGIIASRGSFSRSRLRISARNLKMPLLTHGPTWFSERINLPVSTRRKQCACLRLELMSLNLWLTAFLFCSLVKIRKTIYEPWTGNMSFSAALNCLHAWIRVSFISQSRSPGVAFSSENAQPVLAAREWSFPCC